MTTHRPTTRPEPLVRYVSPFGSPASMTRAEAERHLAEDDRAYEFHAAAGTLSEHQRAIGPPRIERPHGR